MKKTPHPKSLPLVEVTWADAASHHGGWTDVSDAAKDTEWLIPATTVGYLVRRTKKEIVVAQTVAENATCAAFWAVPGAWVTGVRVIRR